MHPNRKYVNSDPETGQLVLPDVHQNPAKERAVHKQTTRDQIYKDAMKCFGSESLGSWMSHTSKEHLKHVATQAAASSSQHRDI